MNSAASYGVQGTFDELGTPLREATFVVVDLETTGGPVGAAGITEIGAVKVRGGQIEGEFQTLVDPGVPIPPFITVLTGITEVMVTGAPTLGGVLPAFLEFAHGCVLVAHNAPFDVGFLRAACAAAERPWPDFRVLDTARLARRILTRDEVRDCRLATLARHFRSATTPNHRALADARATVDVFHGLIERVGTLGPTTVEELMTFSFAVSRVQRRKRHLAQGLPHEPGVYLFQDTKGEVLYVGKSKDIASRVRSYFTAGEMRSRMVEMVGLAERVVPIVCATTLEAEVRELRLIAQHRPPYNRRSRYPDRAAWVKVTEEPYPRLSIVRRVLADGAAYLGPFASRRVAEQAVAAMYEAFPIRQCTARLSTKRPTPACVLAEMGRCLAPCEHRITRETYAGHVDAVREAMTRDVRQLADRLMRRIALLADARRYEDAAVHRDRLAAFVRAAGRLQRLAALAACPELVAAQPTFEGGWALAVVRYGRLAGAAMVAHGQDPMARVEALIATSETVLPGPGPLPSATAEESDCVLRWLDEPGTRLVRLDGTWSCPAHGADRLRAWLDRARDHRLVPHPSPDRRGLRPVHQPAR